MRRDLAVGLSLSTLWFVGAWSDLIPFLYIADRFPIGALPCWNDFLAVVLNVLLAGAAFAAAAALARRGPAWLRRLSGWALLASLAVPANAIRNHFDTWPERLYAALGPAAGTLAAVCAAAALAAIAIRWHRHVVRGVVAALTIVFPLVPITFAQAGWALSQAGGRMQCGGASAAGGAVAGPAARRVLWIVYDELDQATAFDSRPAGLALPAFDALARESFAAANALPPGDRTERSMPAYLTGLRVADAVLVGRNQLRLEAGGRTFVWSGADTIFARARRMRVNTGLAGFFLPYCAMIGDQLTACDWQPCVTCGRLTGVFGTTLGESMWHQASELAPQYGRRRHAAAYRRLQEDGVALARDGSIGFAVIHLPVPHEPGIYDRARGRMAWLPPDGDGYVHNLALADRSLAQLRTAVADAGLSDRTTLMVFGDHGRRDRGDGEAIADRRVPFLVRLAGDSRAAAHAAPVDLLRVHDLTLDVLSGRIETTGQLLEWAAGPPR